MSASYCVSSVEYLPVHHARSFSTMACHRVGGPSMQLTDLFAGAEATRGLLNYLQGRDANVSGMSLDSRGITAGQMFVALSGGGSHGLKFLDDALLKGATVVLWETVDDADWSAFVAARCRDVIAIPVNGLRHLVGDMADRFYQMPSAHMNLIGLTGTDGKTTVAHFIARALHQGEVRCGVMGTLGNGFPDDLQTATHTTPDVVTTHQILADLHDQGASHLVMEASSHGLDQGRVDAVRFTIAVLTNLTRDHLDYHGTIEAYAAAKRLLFIRDGLQAVVLNNDDEFGRSLLQDDEVTTRKIAYGHRVSEYADDSVLIDSVSTHGLGMDIELSGSLLGDVASIAINSPLLGGFNAENLAAAFAVLRLQGVPVIDAAKRLSALTAVAGRMEAFTADGVLVVVDFAHTPAALEHALGALRSHCEGKLMCVFGCGGDRDRGKRPLMAEVAERLADSLILTDDNPRTENPDHIIREIQAGLQHKDQVRVVRDRAAAIKQSIAVMNKGDVLLLAGKGHEEYQLVGERRFHFSDRDQVKSQLFGGVS